MFKLKQCHTFNPDLNIKLKKNANDFQILAHFILTTKAVFDTYIRIFLVGGNFFFESNRTKYSQDELKKQYRKLSNTCHPDKRCNLLKDVENENVREILNLYFKEEQQKINSTYERLKGGDDDDDSFDFNDYDWAKDGSECEETDGEDDESYQKRKRSNDTNNNNDQRKKKKPSPPRDEPTIVVIPSTLKTIYDGFLHKHCCKDHDDHIITFKVKPQTAPNHIFKSFPKLGKFNESKNDYEDLHFIIKLMDEDFGSIDDQGNLKLTMLVPLQVALCSSLSFEQYCYVTLPNNNRIKICVNEQLKDGQIIIKHQSSYALYNYHTRTRSNLLIKVELDYPIFMDEEKRNILYNFLSVFSCDTCYNNPEATECNCSSS